MSARSSGCSPSQVAVDGPVQRLAEPRVGEHGGDGLLRAASTSQGAAEQVGEVEHLDAVVAQRLGERVVLVLGAADPRDAVEEQLVVVARRQPLELRPGPVQHHRPQPADLAVDAVRRPAAVAPPVSVMAGS